MINRIRRRDGVFRNRFAVSLEFERFEPRVLLAGDVSVFVDTGQLFVIGDALANQLQIIGTADGRAQVIGLDGTTINGTDMVFVAGGSLQNAAVQLNAGDDQVAIQGLVLPGRLLIQGNAGNDRLQVSNSSVGSFFVDAGTGDDLLELDNLFVAGSSSIQTGDGNDIVAIGAFATGRYLRLFTGDGDDIVAVNRMNSGRLMALATGSGNDQVLWSGETWVDSGSGIRLGAGDDFLGILPRQSGASSHLNRHTIIGGGQGDDQIALDAGVSNGHGSMFSDRSGENSLTRGGANIGAMVAGFNSAPKASLTEILDRLFESLAAADVDPAPFGGPELARHLELTTNSSIRQYTENDNPVTIDETLQINGPAGALITSATVAIQGFPDAADSLIFIPENFGSVFDNSTGVLTLTPRGDQSLEAWQNALRSVSFYNSSENPDISDRTIVFTVNNAEDTATANRLIAVVGLPDAPQLSVTGETRTFDIDDDLLQRPLPVDPGVTLTDADTIQFDTANVFISIASGLQPGDQLAVTGQQVGASYSSQTGILTLSGVTDIDTLQEVLRSLTFDNQNSRPILGNRIINISVSDGTLSTTRNVLIDVTASESVLVDVNNSLLSFTETDAATTVDPLAMVEPGPNASNDSVDSATVKFQTGYVAGQDMLEFVSVAGISGSFDGVTGILSFTGIASAASYQELFRSIRYANGETGANLVPGDRTIEFSIESNGNQSTDSRIIRVSPASQERLIQNYLLANNLVSQQTESGLHYIVEVEGNGNFPTATDKVTVNYAGFLLDGTPFDDGQNVTFSLSSVIAGWKEGIPMFSVGGKGQLLIPSALAYGENGAPPNIPPNAILRFEVELLGIEQNWEILDVCLDGHSSVQAHEHAMLSIVIDDVEQVIEANIGIDDSPCIGMRGIHTHDASGTLHIETTSPMDAPLGAFFQIWGQTFNSNQILDSVADANHEVVMFVNGELNDQYGNYLMHDDDVIVIEYRHKL